MKITLNEMLSLKNLEDITEDDLEIIGAEVSAKTDGYILMFDKADREVERLSSLIKALQKEKKFRENEIVRAKNRLRKVLVDNGIQNIKGDLGTINLRSNSDSLYIDNTLYKSDEEVCLELGSKYKDDLFEVVNKPVVKLNKTKLTDAILNGLQVKGITVMPQEKSIVIPKIKLEIE